MTGKPVFEALQESMWRLNSEVTVRMNGANSIMLTGPRGGEGASTLALALAAGAARYDAIRVLLIDADFRSASLTESEGAQSSPGLRDWKPGEPLPVHPSRQAAGVDFLPSGHEQRTTMPKMVKSGVIEALHTETARTYGLVVWDAPPLIPSPDTSMLVPRLDGVILVVASGRSLTSDLTRSVDEIAGVNGRLISVVRNRAYKGSLGY